jgi:hypothetical protein
MSDRINYPSQVSIGNALAQPEYTPDNGYLAAPQIQDFANFAVPPTGEQQNLDFLDEPYNPQWPESKKNRWEEYNFGEVAPTPAGAAQRTLAEMEAERQSAAQARDPKRQAEVATAQMALSEKQMKLQEEYRQEMTYQRLVGIMNNPKTPSAQWNAARIQLEGLSASIGQRMIPTGASATALSQKKNTVGYIGALESKNPLANFGPRFDMMQRESQDRTGLLRQQMEAAGVPVPEMAAEQEEEQAPPDWVQITMQKNAVRTPDGEAMTIQPPGGGQPQPIIKGWNQGKQEYRSVGPDGMFYLLTPQQLQQLGLE